MKNFAFDAWDRGRLTINAEFTRLFQQHQLTTCESIWEFSQRAIPAKALRSDRVTLRFSLADEHGAERMFYIKRHGRSSWKEYVKPWLQGQKPLLGARPEWEALLAFHAQDLPTMIPVARGLMSGRSFLITEGLEGCDKLSAILTDEHRSESERRRIILHVADIARQMHTSGLHHQDFYLGHFLQERTEEPARAPKLYVIDLGRVRPHGPYFFRRWIVKDLAELNYSAKTARAAERLRFLRRYFDRPLSVTDRPFIRRILQKTSRIARHSAKNSL